MPPPARPPQGRWPTTRKQQQPPAGGPVEPGEPRIGLELLRQEFVGLVNRGLAIHASVVSAIALRLQTT